MLTITDVVTKLIQFNKTERPVMVKLHKRGDHGDVIETKTFAVEAVFSHGDECAEIFVTENT